jgi:hypothetical protein
MNELIALGKIAQWQKLKALVLDSVSSPITKRVYNMALEEFYAWFQQAPRPGVTQPGTIQWPNPNAFVSSVDPSTGACVGGDTPQNCQFGNLGRNALRGPDFTWSDLYLTKWFALNERVKLRNFSTYSITRTSACRRMSLRAYRETVPRRPALAR